MFILLITSVSKATEMVPLEKSSGIFTLKSDTYDSFSFGYAFPLDDLFSVELYSQSNKNFADSVLIPRVIWKIKIHSLFTGYLFGGYGISSADNNSKLAESLGGQINFKSNDFLASIRQEYLRSYNHDEDNFISNIGYRIYKESPTKYWLLLESVSRRMEDNYRWGPAVQMEASNFAIAIGVTTKGDAKLNMSLNIP